VTGYLRSALFTALIVAFPAHAAPHMEQAQRIADRLLDQVLDVSGAPGVSAAVVVDGDVIWRGVAGFADVEAGQAVTPDSMFRLASVSKLYTVALALQAAEAGVLDLDADVRTYVTSWPSHDGAVITPRQLAAHTAGINHYQSVQSSGLDVTAHYPDIVEALGFFADAPLLFRPGEDYSYSSFGYALLSAAIAGATGESFGDALETQLIDVLDLKSTALEDVRDLPAAAVTLYQIRAAGPPRAIPPNDQSFVWGATGVLASASDVARFGAAFLSDAIVSSETRAMALTPYLLPDGETGAASDRYDVGFGWRVGVDWDERPVAHHAGLTPGARSILLGYPETGAAVAVLSNARWISRMETTAELIAAPFFENEGLDGVDCPAGAWDVSGSVGDNTASAIVTLDVEDGLCVGMFILSESRPEGLTEHPTRALTRIGRRADGHLFALAHQWGLARLIVSLDETEIVIGGDIVGHQVDLSTTPAMPPGTP